MNIKNGIYRFYYFLASLDLLTIIITLILAYNIHQLYEKTVNNNEISTVMPPGNNVFETKNPTKEKILFDSLYKQLNTKITSIEEDLSNIQKSKQIETLSKLIQ